MPVAIAFCAYGPPKVLYAIEIDEPVAGTGEVRVRVRAAGVAPFDCRLRRGEFAAAFKGGFPQRVGNEFSGTVDQVGADVVGLAVGDDVFGFTTARAYTQVVTVPAGQVARKPAAVPWSVAATLPVAGQGAVAVVRQLAVGPGDVLLVHAAAGAIGSMTVQLARRAGAEVVGTASEANHEYLRSLGAVPVTYGDGLADRVRALAPDGISAALDAVGGASVALSLALGAPANRVVSLVGQEEAVAAYGIRPLNVERSAAVLAELGALAAADALRFPVAAFDLADAAAAHERVEAGHGRGKTVLIVER